MTALFAPILCALALVIATAGAVEPAPAQDGSETILQALKDSFGKAYAIEMGLVDRFPSKKIQEARAQGNMTKAEFKKQFLAAQFAEIPIPERYLSAMHMPANVPKNIMRCYERKIAERTIHLLWSEDYEVFLVVVNFKQG